MILLQIYTAIFAAALAWLNKIPCRKMIDFGASISEEKEWHKVNALVKFLWAFIWPLIIVINDFDLIECSLVFVVLILILWVVFDCVLGKILHGSFFYIGETAKTDKLLKEVFGHDAGLMKFLIACVLILFINFYL